MPSQNVRFIGGPLDGRMQDLRDSEAVAGRLLRHIHLHDGPKIETQYELHYSAEAGWVYHHCHPGS
ncbi:hypothetical protein SAMN02982929_03181 [Saccharopolyspora kobensis]|uniref:Uncharacterized protein n=1 Tax=Saccharopolyspora kobensis TaxID=146035 RepID=A0A1H6C6X0_9PSEU|nr:hypothetical protein [Saccharopolyspora kobensis]SEG68714.1 hypothetical protein SAMN02982929_03181 [Saccharopolyspora kobensis]SFC30755.1 hypothetical protein SAMN05216506_101422 [Saccharopolyspora kobensis]